MVSTGAEKRPSQVPPLDIHSSPVDIVQQLSSIKRVKRGQTSGVGSWKLLVIYGAWLVVSVAHWILHVINILSPPFYKETGVENGNPENALKSVVFLHL